MKASVSDPPNVHKDGKISELLDKIQAKSSGMKTSKFSEMERRLPRKTEHGTYKKWLKIHY